MDVKLLDSDTRLADVAAVLLQLRSGFEQAALIDQIKEQRRSGYELAYVDSNGEVLCVAGFVIALKLAWGKHMYIDDFVTSQDFRSSGAGTHLMNWLRTYALQRGCRQIHLDSGVQNFAAHRFYLRQRFHISSHHFAIKELPDGEGR